MYYYRDHKVAQRKKFVRFNSISARKRKTKRRNEIAEIGLRSAFNALKWELYHNFRHAAVEFTMIKLEIPVRPSLSKVLMLVFARRLVSRIFSN